MARPKSKGAYVPLAAHYFMDDAILEAGPDAELLYVRCLSFLASVATDGFITDRQVRSIVGLGLRNVSKRLASLQRVGLLTAVEGGFVVRSWTKWNKSAEEIGKFLAKDRQRKAGKDVELARNSVRNPDGSETFSTLQSSTEQSSTEQSSTEQSSNTSSDASGADVDGFSAEVVALCEELAVMVRANGHKVGVVGKTWWQACDRLMRLDGFTAEQIRVMAKWSTSDEFWSSNIRSMATLREKFSTLRAQRNRKLQAVKPSTVEHGRTVDAILAERESEQLAVGA